MHERLIINRRSASQCSPEAHHLTPTLGDLGQKKHLSSGFAMSILKHTVALGASNM
jgi:hypothetical protein